MPPRGSAAILPEASASLAYDADCRRCARLAAFLDQVHAAHPGYFCRPVAPFGAADAMLVVVGLAPGMHGANATGRPFTGDHAGIILYSTLHRYGFASQPVASARDDGLGARWLPGHQCSEMPAAGEQAHAVRNAHVQPLSGRPSSLRCPQVAPSSPSDESRMMRQCGRLERRRRRSRSRTAPGTPLRAGSRSSTAITAAATTPIRGG